VLGHALGILMNTSFFFTAFAVLYLGIALSVVAMPLVASFYAMCFGVSAFKAAHA
jgi:hypothetical protein